MKPTREQIKKIILKDQENDEFIDRLERLIGDFSSWYQEPMIDVFDVLYPIEILYPAIHDCISYWKYDCVRMGTWRVQNMDWKGIDIIWWSLDSLKEYLEREWLIK